MSNLCAGRECIESSVSNEDRASTSSALGREREPSTSDVDERPSLSTLSLLFSLPMNFLKLKLLDSFGMTAVITYDSVDADANKVNSGRERRYVLVYSTCDVLGQLFRP